MDRIKEHIKNNKWLLLSYLFVGCIVGITAFLMYRSDVRTAINEPRSVMTVKREEWYIPDQSIPLTDGIRVEQDITMVSSKLTGISLWFDEIRGAGMGTLLVELQDSFGQLVYSWEINCNEIAGNSFYRLMLPQTIVQVGDVYSIIIEAHLDVDTVVYLKALDLANIRGTNEFLHKLSTEGVSLEEVIGEDIENNNGKGYTLSYEIFDGGCDSLLYFYVAVVLGVYLCLLVTYIMIVTHRKKEWTFVAVTFVVGCIYLFVISPYMVPDESSHFVTAYAQSSMLMGQTALDENGYVLLQQDAADYLTRVDKPVKSCYANYIRGLFGKNDSVSTDVVTSRKPLTMYHLGYVPQVLGLTLGRILSLNSTWVFTLGRLFALLLYCFVMFWAVRLMPEFGKNVLFIVGLFPMTMQLVVSYSYDSIMLGAAFFLTAYMLYLAYNEQKEKVNWKDYLLLILVIAIIVPIKLVYIPLVGLGILIPKEKFGNMKKKVAAGSGLLIWCVTSVMMTRMGQIVKTAMTSSATPGAPQTYTIMDCIQNPLHTLVVFYNTIEQNLSTWFETMIGNRFGYWDIVIPNIIIYGFALLLLLSLLQLQSEQCVWKGWNRVWFVLLFGVAAGIVCLTMYMDWTPKGAEVIAGVQGKYFIPVLPIAMLALQNNRIVLKKKIDTFLISGTCVLQIAALMSIMSVIITR